MSERPISIIVLTDEQTLWGLLEQFLDLLGGEGKLAGTWTAEMVSGTEAHFCFSEEADARSLTAICSFSYIRWFRES